MCSPYAAIYAMMLVSIVAMTILGSFALVGVSRNTQSSHAIKEVFGMAFGLIMAFIVIGTAVAFVSKFLF